MLNKQIERIVWYGRYRLARSRARENSIRALKKNIPVKNILVLCYGNIYRSPFVATYLNQYLSTSPDTLIKSAGFFPRENRKSEEKYIALVEKEGINLSSHRSRVVSKEQLKDADIVIIMDGKNYKLSLLMDSSVSDKLIWLGAFSEEKANPVEIADPYGRALNQQVKIVQQMRNCCEGFISLLKASSNSF